MKLRNENEKMKIDVRVSLVFGPEPLKRGLIWFIDQMTSHVNGK